MAKKTRKSKKKRALGKKIGRKKPKKQKNMDHLKKKHPEKARKKNNRFE